MSSLFITGAAGFIGNNLIQKIDPTRYQNIYCLSRSGGATTEFAFKSNHFQFIKGDLYEPESYTSYLESCDTVIHLAATTGKAAPEEYFNVNASGTQLLVERCEQQGVKNFLYVSTIAVKFPDKTRYYYAQSKEQGEDAVKTSRLNYVIVRPTIVIGKGALIWKTLSNLARKPVLLMLGEGTARIQPIYIDDLTNCLLTILHENLFANEIFEIGGPEKITFEHFLKKIHHFYYGKEPSVVHVPLKPVVSVLSFFEKFFNSTLPVSVGQLSAFSNDGTIEMNKLFSLSVSHMRSVNSMLKQVISNE